MIEHSLIYKVKNRAPEYSETHEDFITTVTVDQGGRAGTATRQDAWERGKFFLTKYEVFMYALCFGLKNNYQVPLDKQVKKKTFIDIKSWKPESVVDYLLCGVIGLSDEIDLFKAEGFDDKQMNEAVSLLKRDIEEYANGGFFLLKAKIDDDPSMLRNDFSFIDLLQCG